MAHILIRVHESSSHHRRRGRRGSAAAAAAGHGARHADGGVALRLGRAQVVLETVAASGQVSVRLGTGQNKI